MEQLRSGGTLADQLTLCQPGWGSDYTQKITIPPPPKFSDIPTALSMNESRVMVVGK